MTRHHAWMCSAIVAAIVAAAAPHPRVAHAEQTAARPVNADHARLTAMIGTWDVEMTLWPRPGGAGLPTKGTSTIRPLFDGLFVEEKIEGTLNGAPFTTLAWTGFNPGTRQYEATRISSTNSARIAETGTYDDTTKRFERLTTSLMFQPSLTNRVVRRLANRYPAAYEQRWAWIFPAWFLYFELRVVK